MFFRSENKDYYLEAPDRAVMMFWLQELQKRRRSHATQRNSDFLPYKVWIDIYKLYYSSLAYIWNQIFNIYTTKILSSGGLVKITFPLESETLPCSLFQCMNFDEIHTCHRLWIENQLTYLIIVYWGLFIYYMFNMNYYD